MSINVNDKNLGHATAYAYYKAGGGTMTEAEFTEFMADFGTASQTAVEAAQAALASETAARTAATTATNKASEATTAAQTATTKAGEASTSASTATSAKDTAVSASQTATTKATEATTAAATATSAATTATTAKDDAVSAKTAAQTAQTGAETAAASVQSSAAQIATNTEDIESLKSELNVIGTLSENKFDKTTILNNSIFYSGGGIGSSTTHFVSDYIPVNSNLMYLYPRVANDVARVFGYDSNKANQTAITIGDDYTINTTGYVYIRFSGKQSALDTIMVTNTYQTTYSAYGYLKAIVVGTLDTTIDNYNASAFDNNGLLYINDWDNRIYYQGQGIWGNTRTRIGTQKTYTPSVNIIASAKTGYYISVTWFNSTTPSVSTEAGHTGWVTSIILPKGQAFVMNCKINDADDITADTGGFNSHVQFLPYEKEVSFANYVKGKPIDLTYQGYTYSRVGGGLPSPSDIATGLTARQDFAMYNDVMFQLYSPDYVALINPVTGNAIASYPIDCGHGNSCQFSNEFYDSDDDYPLLYCFGYTDNFVYVNRVTDSDATLIRKYKLDTNGYRFSGGYDAQNNRIISIHYSQDSSTVETNNYCIITVWDLNNTTIDANGDYIPTIKKQTTIPFLPIIQGCEVFKGNLYVISGQMPSYNVPVKITAFDEDGNVITAIDNFPSLISNSEGEGISFFIDESSYKCYFTTLFLYELLLE